MRTRLRNRAGSESGANAVEFALVSLLVFPLIFGGITGAWAWNTQQTLTHAAREGARFAATLPNPENAPSDWHDAVVARTVEAVHGISFDPDDSGSVDEVCVYYTDGGEIEDEPGEDDDWCFTDELEGPRVQVQVSTPAQIFTAFLPEDWTDLRISASAVARHEGAADDNDDE